ncbi:MAG: hypothetical protein AAB468_00805 [Patescibacteria group bacterium]
MAVESRPTQDFVEIAEIRDGVVVLKNGGLRIILIASSLNFALKSEEEKEAIIFQYQNFLNSLDFHIQLFIQSRQLDIKPYIAMLEGLGKDQVNDLIKIQTREYVEFIKNFTDSTDIMTKNFFVVVPYDPPIMPVKSGWLGRILNKRGSAATGGPTDQFDERRSQLEQRVGVVNQGLSRFGVRVATLGTEELVEIYFKMFNPGEVAAPTAV